jgi:hypothetical protein
MCQLDFQGFTSDTDMDLLTERSPCGTVKCRHVNPGPLRMLGASPTYAPSKFISRCCLARCHWQKRGLVKLNARLTGHIQPRFYHMDLIRPSRTKPSLCWEHVAGSFALSELFPSPCISRARHATLPSRRPSVSRARVLVSSGCSYPM